MNKLFKMHIHIHIHQHRKTDEDVLQKTFDNTQLIKTQNQQLMAKFADIKTAFEELKTAVTDERTQANAKLDELLGKISQLETNINEGGTTEERTQFLADIKTLATDVKSIIPDPVVDPIPPVEGDGNTGENGGTV